jgi:hypothetical protein
LEVRDVFPDSEEKASLSGGFFLPSEGEKHTHHFKINFTRQVGFPSE